ncbi:membrane protein [Motilibacter rhizosphaerae]|uniref:Membrane protein n=1 Tax=Motilibacter rhizosphaerae TaxID=598652 RepID=A0A4V2F539_9ACTN|nr:YihY/virulence factor BrkB family protein [Motilibacter rhizosphaerae]RZS91479.1 membrane protein [Motilibacter rhizosphaerae]
MSVADKVRDRLHVGAHDSKPSDDRPQVLHDRAAEPATAQRQPGAQAEKPTDIPAAGWKQILERAWKESKEDNVSLLAAGVAFFAFLAVFPAAIAAVTLYGLFADPTDVAKQADSLTSGMPADTRSLITRQLTAIAGEKSGALSVGLVISLLAALWSASGGMGNLMKAINIAYDEEETRTFVKLRSTALALTVGAIVFIVVAVGLIAVLPSLLDGLGTAGVIAVQVVRWVGLVVAVMVALAVAYRYAPDRDDPKFPWTSQGAVIGGVIWIIASVAFALYASRGGYSNTYGALAGVVVLMMWLYITSYIVLLGAEINAESERQTMADTTVGAPRPKGERRAVASDTFPEDAAH